MVEALLSFSTSMAAGYMEDKVGALLPSPR